MLADGSDEHEVSETAGMYDFMPEEHRHYWEKEHRISYDERGRCDDDRVREMAEVHITPERVAEVVASVKDRLATGVDEFSAALIKRGPETIKYIFAAELREVVGRLSYPKSWRTWHATLIPKPGKDRRTLKGYREIWVQSHLWKLIVGCVAKAIYEPISKVRVWCNAGYEERRGCPEQSLSLRLQIEMATVLGISLHVYMQDYAAFFPSIARVLSAYLQYIYGVRVCYTELIRSLQDVTKGCFITARGPTRLAKLLKGICVGCPIGPTLSLPVVGVTMRAMEKLVAMTVLLAPKGHCRASGVRGFADDNMSPDQNAAITQLSIEVSVIISRVYLGLEVGHDAVEASKSVILGMVLDKQGRLVCDEDTVFYIPLGPNGENVKLSRAQVYTYLGIVYKCGLMDKTNEEKVELKTTVLLELFSNVGGGAADQMVEGVNSVKQGCVIFQARTAPFEEEMATRIDAKANGLLADHGHRLRHHRVLTTMASYEAGGLAVRAQYPTIVAAVIDELMRGLAGRDGEPGRLMLEQTVYMTAARLGWAPSEAEPTPYDFMPEERWATQLSEAYYMENVYRLLIRFKLRMRGTGASSQGATGKQWKDDESESESTRLSPRLASVKSIDLSVWLHAQGIARMEDVRGGEGGLRTVEEMEATFSRRAWSSKQRAVVTRLLKQAKASVEVTEWLEEIEGREGLRGEGRRDELEEERRQRQRERAVDRGERPIERVAWTKIDERTEVRMYEVIMDERVGEVSMSEEAMKLHVTNNTAVYATKFGSVEAAEHQLEQWRREAEEDEVKSEPRSMWHYLTEKLGEEGATKLGERAFNVDSLGEGVTEAKIELMDLLCEYARRKRRGARPEETNVQEDRESVESLRLHPSPVQHAFKSKVVEGKEGEESRHVICIEPGDKDVQEKREVVKVTAQEGRGWFNMIDWVDEGTPTTFWLQREGQGVYVSGNTYFTPAAATTMPAVRPFVRIEEMEKGDGLEYLLTDGQTMTIKIKDKEWKDATPERNMELAEATARLDKQRGGYMLTAALDGSRTPGKGDEPPKVGSGAYYGYQKGRRRTCLSEQEVFDEESEEEPRVPLLDAVALPPDRDIGAAELMAVILVLRRAVKMA